MIKVSDAELEVLKILWEANPDELPLSSSLVIRRLEGRGWSDNTIKTLLGRLAKKGAIELVQAEGRNHYRHLIAREEFVLRESQSFADKLLDGLSFPLLANFLAKTDLKPGEIDELKRILEQKNRE